MHQSEGTYDGRTVRCGQQLGDLCERLVFCTAVRLDERAGGSANPRAPDGIHQQREQLLFELPIRMNTDRRAVRQERLGDFLEVVHVRTKQNRLAEHRGLEDVVTSMIDEAS